MRHTPLDPSAPLRSLRDLAGLGLRELAGLRGVAHTTLLQAEQAGAEVKLSTLLATAEAAGWTVEIRAAKKSG